MDWLSGDNSAPEDAGSYPEFYETVDTVIMGFHTYHQIVTELEPNKWPYQGKQTYVITHRDEAEQQGISFYHGNLSDLLASLKKQGGKEIWICGGAQIAQQLIMADQIDEFCISIIPTILGSGIKLFPDLSSQKQLKLLKTKSYNGIVDLVYTLR